MIATVQHVTQRLVDMLCEQHDDGEPPLFVREHARVLVVQRRLRVGTDSVDLSASEAAHVAAILAAHAAEPIE